MVQSYCDLDWPTLMFLFLYGKKLYFIVCYLLMLVFFWFFLQDELTKILGEKHQLDEFLNTLYVKCSYLLFSKEHATTILSEIIRYKSAENDQRIQSCMNLLVVRSCHFGCIDLLPFVLGHLHYAFFFMILEQFLLQFIADREGWRKFHRHVYIYICLYW
jgi:hypothetical protein